MTSFILRQLDPDFWARVRAKADAEGTTVKAVILRLLSAWLAACALLSVSGCGYHAPTGPTPTPPIADTVPFALSLNATSGMGADAGQGVITARVQNVHGVVMAGVPVQFETDLGTLSETTVVTGADGLAATRITASDSAAITATAGTLTTHARVASQPVPLPAPPPPPPIFPPPPPPPGPLGVALTAASVTVGTQTIVTANVSHGPGVSFAWTFGDGGTFAGISSTAGHTYAAVGSYVVDVTVRDAGGRTASGSTTATVTAVPPPPPPPPPPAPSYSVTLSASPSSLVINNSATLTATVTATNGAPAPTSYAWDCNNNGVVDGSDSTTAINTTSCAYTSAGSITSKVTASSATTSGSGTTTVTVAAAAPLFVSIGAPTPSPVLKDVDSTYTGTVTSSAAVPATLQWEWDHDGDGTPDAFSTGASPKDHTFSYGSPGVKTLKLTVRDPATGRTASTSRTVTVS